MKIRVRKLLTKIVSVLLITVIAVSTSLFSVNAVESSDDAVDSVVVVSLGDSYSSGEGIEPFYGQEKSLSTKVYTTDWLAHRSQESWPGLLEIPNVEGTLKNYRVEDAGTDSLKKCQWYFRAVSGAETKHFKNEQQKKTIRQKTLSKEKREVYLPLQLDVFKGISEPVDYVTLSVGGNDVGFADIITNCVLESTYLHHGTVVSAMGATSFLVHVPTVLEMRFNSLWNNIDTTRENIKKTYIDISQAAPEAEIIVAGYPKLLDKNGKGFAISKEEATLVNNNVHDFNKELKSIVTDCQKEGIHIHFVDVETEFDMDGGHQAYSSDPWINEIKLGSQSEDLEDNLKASAYSIHPNKEGAIHYAKCVNKKIEEIENRKQKGQLSGKVCQALDRVTPIYGATVTFYREMAEAPLPSNMLPYYAEKSVKTDQNGNYSTDLPIGNYRVEISANGYISFNSYTQVLKDQNSYMETFLMVEGDSSSKGIAAGTISNALTGLGVSDVNLTVRKDWNNNNQGDIVAMSKTDTNGHYSVELPLGNYTVTAEKDEHVTTSFNIIVQQGTTSNQNGVITPLLSGEDFRIVLTWGESPRDLDSHVRGIKSDGDDFHVYYSHKSEYDGDKEICNLDVDDTTSYGPETITLHATESSPYYYYIHRYSSSGTLGASEAKIEVYQGENLIATYNVPTNMENYEYWNVFAIKDGQLIVKNTITDEPDITYEKDNVYKTVYSIPKDEVESTKNLNMVEWHPLEGLTSTMLGFSTDETVIDISPEGTWTKNGNLVSKPMEIVDNSGTVLDAAGFVMNWISNAQEITQLKVSTGKNNTMQIDYGSSFELGHSGKKTTLGELLVDKYYNYSPSIVFTYSDKADECIRNWFGLTGDGKYYMDLEFGKVYVGDFGYRLVVEDNELYQVPIIHEDSSYKVYYKEKGKDPVFVLDAADVLRCTRIKLSEEEKNKVLNQLSENGFEINIK